MTSLFDNKPVLVLKVQDFGDESRCVTSDGRIVRRFAGWKHEERAYQYAHAFTEGYRFREEQCQDLR